MKAPIISLLFLASTAYAMPADQDPTQLEVSSPAFNANQEIPADFTCEGAGTAPALNWSTPPAGTRSVAIIVEDTDAPNGTFTHWLVTGISPRTTHLAKGGALPEGAFAASNDKGKIGYAGPCPPDGATHHYHFHVYALDKKLDKRMTKAAFISAIQGHVLAQGELVGTYQK
jgi:Raf kinase inhibitor-like YbhB/YbcL family protein